MIKLSLLKIKEAQTFKLDFFVSLISIFIKTIMGATILFFLQFLIRTYTPHVKDVLILRDVISGNPLRAMDFAMQLLCVILLGVLTYSSYQKNVSHNVEYGD